MLRNTVTDFKDSRCIFQFPVFSALMKSLRMQIISIYWNQSLAALHLERDCRKCSMFVLITFRASLLLISLNDTSPFKNKFKTSVASFTSFGYLVSGMSIWRVCKSSVESLLRIVYRHFHPNCFRILEQEIESIKYGNSDKKNSLYCLFR